jgi:hypothetical protein
MAWEYVEDGVARLSVPGGWLYSRVYASNVSVAFVPNPENVKTSDELRIARSLIRTMVREIEWARANPGPEKVTSYNEPMLAIHRLLDKKEWSADTLDKIALVMADAGFSIRDNAGSDFVDADAPDYTKAQEHLDNVQESLAKVQKMYDPPRWMVLAMADGVMFVATPALFITKDEAEKFAATLLTSYRIVDVVTPFQEG